MLSVVGHLQSYSEEWQRWDSVLCGTFVHPRGPAVRVFDPRPCEGSAACHIPISK